MQTSFASLVYIGQWSGSAIEDDKCHEVLFLTGINCAAHCVSFCALLFVWAKSRQKRSSLRHLFVRLSS